MACAQCDRRAAVGAGRRPVREEGRACGLRAEYGRRELGSVRRRSARSTRCKGPGAGSGSSSDAQRCEQRESRHRRSGWGRFMFEARRCRLSRRPNGRLHGHLPRPRNVSSGRPSLDDDRSAGTGRGADNHRGARRAIEQPIPTTVAPQRSVVVGREGAGRAARVERSARVRL